MSNVYTGVATIRGFAGTIAGVTGAASLSQTSGELSTEYPVEILRGKFDQPTGIASADGLMRFDLTFTIQATSTANATLAATEPTRQAAVTLSGFNSGASGTYPAHQNINHARWAIMPGTWRFSYGNDKIAEYKCQIVCATDPTVNLAAVIS